MQKKDFIVFGSPLIEQPEIDEVISSMKSGWLGTGPKVCKFENMFKKYKGSRFAIALNSGTAALHLSMIAIGIKHRDEVIVPTMTFSATANSIIHAGGIPVFVDCEPDYFHINSQSIEKAITKNTKSIIAVHLYGQPVQMEEIKTIAEKNNLLLIEDCAQAHLAEFKGKPVGTFGAGGCFSFYPSKNLFVTLVRLLAGIDRQYDPDVGDAGILHQVGHHVADPEGAERTVEHHEIRSKSVHYR